LELDYKPIGVDEVWGQAWDSAWFHVTGTIPSEWKGREVVAVMAFAGEALVFDDGGVPLRGLTDANVFVPGTAAKVVHPLTGQASGGESIDLWVEAAANGLFGVKREPDPQPQCPTRHGTYTGKVTRMEMAIFDRDVWHLAQDMEVLMELANSLGEGSRRYAMLLGGLSEAIDLFADDPANASRCRQHIRPLLEAPASASAPTINAVGHAHIDTAWLWPVRETIRKTARTFATQLLLLDEYPDYVFGASQPQLYAFARQHYPQLYEKVKRAVADGRWECQGAMWVEADCNIISGESMVRQVLHGKNFYRDEFGLDVRNVWLPDVFGYSASMPQIMRRAGVDYFLTQKLSWSQFNKFPHTTFRWRGIDGTELLTHFPPEDTYNSTLKVAGAIKAEQNFSEKADLDEMMCLFGIGDGGGGPSEEIIERGLRMRDLEGCPKVRFGRADAFFERLEKHREKLPEWNGELYLELHRGTLTTQSRTKRGNRKLELALRELEYLLSLGAAADYPQDQLDALWKTLLIKQFHDIIPGSSIHWVYEQTEAEYAQALATCEQLRRELAGRVFDTDADSLVLVNSLNSAVDQPIALPGGWSGAALADGSAVTTQRESDGKVMAAVALAPQQIVTLRKADSAEPTRPTGQLVLENDLVRYEFDADARLTKAYDKQARRDILDGCGNVLTLYNDRPNKYDAWDIDIFYETQAVATAQGAEAPIGETGPVRQVLRFELTVGNSRLWQTVTLSPHSKRLDFVTTADWQERHRMLRVAFPTSVRSDQASFEIQYGHTRRPTHRNTSWDMARFEVPAQRWADLSDSQYGAALLNDCKYGHKIHDNVIDLNLLRSPTHPDPDADLGRHQFTYSLLGHSGVLIESDVMAQAAQLNQPPALLAGFAAGDIAPPVTVSGAGVDLAVVKKAEKSDYTIVRLVETRGCRTTAEVTLADKRSQLVEVDLMEWNELAEFGAGKAVVEMAPFEIRTFKVVPI
jgi:alpha-mannosidase